jgi:hypothetical protein
MRSLAPLVVCVVLTACSPPPQHAIDAAERARPYVAQFEQFERWVTRAENGSAVLRERAALSEAVFAPLRRADDVLGAWVHLPGRPVLDLALPSAAPEPSLQGAARLRDQDEAASLLRPPDRGELWALVQRPCALPQAPECVLLAREARTKLGPLRVVAAFR